MVWRSQVDVLFSDDGLLGGVVFSAPRQRVSCDSGPGVFIAGLRFGCAADGRLGGGTHRAGYVPALLQVRRNHRSEFISDRAAGDPPDNSMLQKLQKPTRCADISWLNSAM